MSKFDKKMEEFFDIVPQEPVNTLPVESKVNFNNLDSDFKNDYEKVRENFYELIEKGKDAFEDIMAVAKESEKARDFEVASSIFKDVLEANDKLLDMHKKVRDITNYNQKTVNNTEINNTLFVGSTKELSQILKDLNNPNIIDIDQLK
jgi:formiminotetrahydrofolate cyclodeaminase